MLKVGVQGAISIPANAGAYPERLSSFEAPEEAIKK